MSVNVAAKVKRLVQSLVHKLFRVSTARGVHRYHNVQSLLLKRRFLDVEMNKAFKDCGTVLEIGAGLFEQLRFVSPKIVRVGVEIFLPYIEHRVCDSKCICVHYDALKIDELFVDNSFDAVMMIDVLEHFERQDALRLLEKVQRIAKKKLFLFVPEGIHPQHKDDRGFGNDYYMSHRSTWYAEDLMQLGFHVEVWGDYHHQEGKESGAMICIKNLGKLEHE